MSSYRKILILALAVLIGAPAMAADKGGYLGLGYGEWPSEDFLGVVIDERDYRGFVGYRFNPYVSLQFDAIYTDVKGCFGSVCDSVNPWLGEASVRPSFPITKWFELYGRAGYVATLHDDNTDADVNEWTWALGLEVRPWRGLAFRGEYYGVEWDSDSFDNGAWGVSVLWNFREP